MNDDFHLYLDSADLAELETCLPHPVVHGVTTNPTLLKRAGVGLAAVPGLLARCIELGARQVQAQVHSEHVDGMLEDARALLPHFDLGQLVIKIPATRQGLDAGARLIAQGVPVTWTAVYAPGQAHFAAQLGAAYAAPYLGRLEDAGTDGLALIAHLGLTDYDLGGYSLGARTTVRMLANGAAPRRVILSGMGLAGLVETAGRGEYFRHVLTHLGSFERGSTEWMTEAFLKTTKGDPVALLRVLDTFVDTPLTAISGMDAPTLVVSGDEDDDNGSASALAEALPHGTFRAVPGNHMSAVTKPELGMAMADFLA
eukprot:gene38237-51651_t